jgi:hypothetical protein
MSQMDVDVFMQVIHDDRVTCIKSGGSMQVRRALSLVPVDLYLYSGIRDHPVSVPHAHAGKWRLPDCHNSRLEVLHSSAHGDTW